MSGATTQGDQQRIERACQGWKDRLVDLSRRNPLLYYQARKTSTLEFGLPRPDLVRRLFAGKAVRIAELSDAPDGAARALAAHKKRVENFEERGLSTLHLAFGLATWTIDDGGRPPAAPLLLLPVSSTTEHRGAREVELVASGDLHVNPVLRAQLEREAGLSLDDEAVLPEVEGDGPFELADVFERVSARVTGRLPSFVVQPIAVLGNFSFQKLAMVRDLAEPPLLAASPVVAALVGLGDAREALAPRGGSLEPSALDRRPIPQDTTILDADSSQAIAVAAGVDGRSGVIQGPPGCGKSQTIANLIAALVADGKRVLFVAEKRAALDVVRRRLERVGLGGLVLDLAGGQLRKRAVAERLAAALAAARSVPQVDLSALDARLEARRAELVAHVARLHTERPPTGGSLLALEGELLCLARRGHAPETRWMAPELSPLGQDLLERAVDDVVAIASEAGLFLGDTPTPWLGAQLERPERLQQALALVRRGPELLSALQAQLTEVGGAAGVSPPATIGEARALEGLLAALARLLERFEVAVFSHDLAHLATALAPASRGWLGRLWASLTSPAYRQAVRALRALARGPAPAPPALLAAVEEARTWRGRWDAIARSGSVPARALATEALARALDAAEGFVDSARAVLALDPDARIEPLAGAVQALRRDEAVAHRVHLVQARAASVRAAGFGAYLDELRRARPDPRGWAEGLRAAWLASWIEHVYLDEPALGGFDGRAHDRVVAEFGALDRERLEGNVARVRARHAQRLFEVLDAHRAQADLVRRESQKKSRTLSLRALVSQAPDVTTTLFPCWMASPLSVSESLPLVPGLFDVVVFDEASQVLPEDAISSLARGKAVIVAGDRHQLPPTTFFADGEPEAGEDDEDDGAGTAGFESLLDVLSTFLETWSLDWHYRSRDERLIAFSNQEVYGGRLVTFPSVGAASSLRHEHVPWRPDQGAGQAQSASDEVARVVELVREHARARPDETLGIITLGIEHQRRVEAALEKAVDADPMLAAFWEREGDERPFVKNLERVQGDERDTIILSLGHTKDATGRLPLRFGPLLHEGGYRRLNVAITRARRRMTLVSSFTHHDIDPVKVEGRRGLQLLRSYLEFAAHRGERDTDRGLTGFPVNAFEADVQAALEGAGLSVVPQLGVSSYRLDLAVRHPRQPGRFVLAVECDGASYHSAPTARDRDRLRQEQLEALGWRFCRVWSTDWFRRRADELARVLQAYRDAVAHAEAADARAEAARGMASQAPAPSDRGSPRPAPSSRPVAVASSPPTASSSPPIEAPSPAQRGPRPPVEPGRPIDGYTEAELDALAGWVRSDGLRRTDAEVAEEVFVALGFKRRGARIVAALEAAARRTRG
jgi:very-short-patch-repair endonuclease